MTHSKLTTITKMSEPNQHPSQSIVFQLQPIYEKTKSNFITERHLIQYSINDNQTMILGRKDTNETASNTITFLSSKLTIKNLFKKEVVSRRHAEIKAQQGTVKMSNFNRFYCVILDHLLGLLLIIID